MLRQQIASGDAEKLQQELERARQGREKWLKERTAANWAVTESCHQSLSYPLPGRYSPACSPLAVGESRNHRNKSHNLYT